MSGAVKRFLPLFDRVLVRRLEAVTTSRGGILIPEKAQKRSEEGEVVAVGPGARPAEGAHLAMAVAVGDKVLLPGFGGSKVELEGQEYQLFRESDIVAKITEH